MKLLRYRGVFYKYAHPSLKERQIERSLQDRLQHIQPEVVPQSVQLICYRGVFYFRELQLAQSATAKAPSDLSPTNLEIVHVPNNNAPTNTSNSRCAIMHSQRMGYLYKLYCLGWRNGSLKCFSPLQHWLLSIFLYYRQGFAEGYEWRQNQMKS